MSASLPDPAAEETELLAGEYVLGTLDPESRLAVERETDPALARAVATWEARLSPLAGLVRAQDPPASLWPRIEASLQDAAAIDAGTAQPRGAAPGADPRRPAPIPRGTAGGRNVPRNLRAWQASTVAGFALAAAIAGIAFLGPQRRPPAPAPTPMPVERVAGLLPLDHPNAPFFVVQMLPGGAVRVTPVGGLKVAADRDLELWVLKPGESVPHPLGVLPAQGVRLAPGSVLPKSGAKILVSLEPRGGSPTGLPTGPVLSGGTI